uniref:Uncharacterized protein n=1 Tax=Oryza punctata TaxID=4537 RepID=A0A0E0MNR4_ORYPU
MRRLTFSNHVPFYRFRWPDDGRRRRRRCPQPQLVHVVVFDGEEDSIPTMSRSCDGLVLLPNGHDVHVINPATGDVLTLPDSSRVAAAHSTGLGLDTRTNTYKVARHTVPSWQGSEGGKYSCNHTAEGGNHACGGCNACVLRRSMPTSCGLKSSK